MTVLKLIVGAALLIAGLCLVVISLGAIVATALKRGWINLK